MAASHSWNQPAGLCTEAAGTLWCCKVSVTSLTCYLNSRRQSENPGLYAWSVSIETPYLYLVETHQQRRLALEYRVGNLHNQKLVHRFGKAQLHTAQSAGDWMAIITCSLDHAVHSTKQESQKGIMVQLD
jgi:hypothetical protein